MPGTGRRLVDADRLKAVVDELGRAMPNDLLEANEIIRQRDSIFSLANLESQRIKNSADEYAASSRSSAEEESRARVNENEIVRQAQAQAQSIQDEAKHEAQQNLEEVHNPYHCSGSRSAHAKGGIRRSRKLRTDPRLW